MPDDLLAASAANPSGTHACWLPACAAPVDVQWRRRLTTAELADLGEGAPAPEDCTRAVHACGAHAIALDLAAHVHQAQCAGPDTALLPACACTPEPLLAPAAAMEQATVTLPSGWTVPAP